MNESIVEIEELEPRLVPSAATLGDAGDEMWNGGGNSAAQSSTGLNRW